jgi:hypothetical protein
MVSKKKSSGNRARKNKVAMRTLKGNKETLTDKEARKVKGGVLIPRTVYVP